MPTLSGGPRAEVLATLAELGGFFAWQADPSGLVPLRKALQHSALGARFAGLRAGLASASGLPAEQTDPRVAVSAVQIGLVSRLWSVSLASAAVHGWVPDLSADAVLIGGAYRNPVPMASAGPARGRLVTGPHEAAAALGDLVLRGAVAAVTEACQQQGRTSRQVLVSNTASALVAAAGVLGSRRPDVAAAAHRIAGEVLRDPVLAAAGEMVNGAFRRHGCCLYYRLPGHGLCGDCVLATAHPDRVTEDP